MMDWKYLAITSNSDTRYDSSGCNITTHDRTGVEAVGVKKLEEVIYTDAYFEASLIIVEEAQFFTDLFDFVMKAVEVDGKDLVVVGLDGDSDRKPFGDILRLIPLADEVVKLTALCKRCCDGTPALFSALVRGTKDSQVHVGGSDFYEPRCRKHYLEIKR